MIISKYKEDYIEVNERWLVDNYNVIEKKYHLVKLCFRTPSIEKMDQILDLLPRTNRFIVCDNIKFYNDYFKNTRKKYYVENTFDDQDRLVSFLRKNNKILIDFTKIDDFNLCKSLLGSLFEDLLRNVEIIKISAFQMKLVEERLKEWNGNVILVG